jgi:hypothetical protein
MSRIAYPSIECVCRYRIATIQYCTLHFYVLCCRLYTVAALPSQNVEHVSAITIHDIDSKSLTERCCGCCKTRIKPLQSLPIFPNGASSHVCGIKRQHPTGVRGTYDRVIYLANWEMCVVVLSCSSFFVSLDTPPCRDGRTM